MPDFTLKMHQIQFSVGAPPQTQLEKLTTLPRPIAGFRERKLKGEREEGGRMERGEGKGREEGEGKGGGRRGKGKW